MNKLDKETFYAVLHFMAGKHADIKFGEKIRLLRKFSEISANIDCPHTNGEIIAFSDKLMRIAHRCTTCVIVEAGCYKGGSTAKFSLIASIIKKKLFVFDSFKGLPAHNEPHTYTIYGKPVSFVEGEYSGTKYEVEKNIAQYGVEKICMLIPGWFEDTMKDFTEPIVGLYIDVDLVASVKDCLKYLYPLVIPGGVICCQDGHLPLIVNLLRDKSFWTEELSTQQPEIEGLGYKKLITIVKL